MIKRRGIALKTFLFTTGLITLVVVISFAILYFVLPDYYQYTKNNRMKDSTERLVQDLNEAGSVDVCVELISGFAVANNAEVMSFDSEQTPLLDLSSAFMFMEGSGISRFTILVKEADVRSESDLRDDVYYKGMYDTSHETSIETGGNKAWIRTSLGTANRASVMTLDRSVSNGIIDNIIITSTLQPIDEAKGVIISLMPFLLVIDILIALIAAYFYARRLTRPIIAISDAAESMRLMAPEAASNVHTNDELGELSRNLDSMYRSLCSNMEDLQLEMKRVELLERSKTDFMRAASHELKTPIAALNGITEGMIDNVGVYKNKEKYLAESKRLIDHMAVLVSEILNASKLEALEDAVVIEPVDVGCVMEQAVSRHKLLAEEKCLEISMDVDGFVYDSDERILLITLSNIISNAFKYAVHGGKVCVALVVTREHSNATVRDGQETAVLYVENECQHIPEDELPKLFEPFYTLNYSRNRSRSGTGLGLFIVKRNLERLQIPYKIENTASGIRFVINFI